MEPRENDSAAGARTEDFTIERESDVFFVAEERESDVFEDLVAEEMVVIFRSVTLNEIWNTRQTRLKQGFTFA